MGRITKDDRCLIVGLRTEKNWAGVISGRTSPLRSINFC